MSRDGVVTAMIARQPWLLPALHITPGKHSHGPGQERKPSQNAFRMISLPVGATMVDCALE
ncbi:MAG: hypothetical protein ABI178_11190 [Rhodanobacter sp.]